ncbi:phytase [Caulobacter sp. LARHSG274]
MRIPTARILAPTLLALLTAACATRQAPPSATVSVPAVRETAAVDSLRDAADDPAIWRDARRPERSLIVATDKQDGLYVYGLDGKIRGFLRAGRVNNVDLRGDVVINGAPSVLVAASDRTERTDGKIALFALNTETAALTALGRFPAQVTEAYGFCLYRRAADRALFAFVVGKDGTISQLSIDVAGPTPKVAVVRQMKLATQSEGCVADDRTGQLYVAEEDVGLWRFSAAPDGGDGREAFFKVDGQRLVADAEGLAILPRGRDGGYLVASSQGDSAYAVWNLRDGAYRGRFRIVASGGVDGTSDTDGIEIAAGDFGPDFPGGLMVAQDGDNSPQAQNFKLLSWRAVEKALDLR